jgi:hypothetical protein
LGLKGRGGSRAAPKFLGDWIPGANLEKQICLPPILEGGGG